MRLAHRWSNNKHEASMETINDCQRRIALLDEGAARTEFMALDDTVRMVAEDRAGYAPFGMIGQKVVKA